jgi:Pvc16 N-terminal domain/Carboxypeptidase regulatory-like domain
VRLQMPAVVDVPLNTCLADLDEALRALLKRELERHGFEGVDIAFDAPASDWSAKLTNPTVNLFLYDLRENVAESDVSTRDVRVNGMTMSAPPPMRLEVTYSVTAWTKAVQDEHRLLSQVLAILFSHVSIPADLLDGRLASASLFRSIETEVGRPKEEKADFWTSIGGRYKASIDYAVKLEVESGLTFTRGPEVRTQTIHMGLKDAPARTVEELMRFGGIVRDKDGEPVPNAWVVLPEHGRFASTDADGRFVFNGMRAGDHKVVARTAAGEEASGTAKVPGGGVDLELGAGGKKKSPAKRG